MRLRLLIPAAMAAAATYAALVRDEARSAEPWAPATAPGPGRSPQGEPAAAAVGEVDRSPEATPQMASRPPFADAAPSTPAATAPPPSPYADLAQPEARDVQKPSIYDLLAGESPLRTPGEIGPEAKGTLAEARREEETPAPPAALPTPPPGSPEPGQAPAPKPAEWTVPLEQGRFALGGYAAGSGHSVVSAVTFRRRLPADPAPERITLELDVSENVAEGGPRVLSDPGFAPDRDGFILFLAARDPGPFSAAGSYRVVSA